jgi:hypothetical protein
MVKRLFMLMLFLMLATASLGDASNYVQKMYPPSVAFSGEDMQIWKVGLTTDASGAATFSPGQSFYGKLYSIQVMHGNNLSGTETLAITSEYPYRLALLSYNVSAGNTTQFPRSSTLLYPLAGQLKFTLTNTSSTGANSTDFFAILTMEV